MAKVVEVEIVNPCPLTRFHPGMFEGVAVFPLVEEPTTDSRRLSEQRFAGQTIQRNQFGNPFDFRLAWRGSQPPSVSPLQQPLFMNLDQLVFPESDLQCRHDEPPHVQRSRVSNFQQLPSLSNPLPLHIFWNWQPLEPVFVEIVHIDREIEHGHDSRALPLDRAERHMPFLVLRAGRHGAALLQIR
ncbi:MAG TPA: hypothetical protein VKP13_16910 [Nitrospira sp.]|nr:hypothetical protein [Nitrospira sp.]